MRRVIGDLSVVCWMMVLDVGLMEEGLCLCLWIWNRGIYYIAIEMSKPSAESKTTKSQSL